MTLRFDVYDGDGNWLRSETDGLVEVHLSGWTSGVLHNRTQQDRMVRVSNGDQPIASWILEEE